MNVRKRTTSQLRALIRSELFLSSHMVHFWIIQRVQAMDVRSGVADKIRLSYWQLFIDDFDARWVLPAVVCC